MKKDTRKKSTVDMPLVNPNAAGIDIGDTMHAVAVPQGRDSTNVRTFGAMTADLEQIVKWLKKCKIDTVAMESTGIYWKPLFGLLVRSNFEVYLVNSKQVRNVSGRKNDEDDAVWIQKLHSCGLLKSSYLPDDEQEALRALVRYRRTLVNDSNRCVLRMQKALGMMNIKIHKVIRDIAGKTGLAIVEAIINGERIAENFLPFVDNRIRADRDMIIKSLQGNWRTEQIFLLKENFTCYKFYRDRISVCDAEIENQLQRYHQGKISQPRSELTVGTRKHANKNKPRFNTSDYFRSILGVDVMAIYGISDILALEILSETGTDMSKWETAKHFVSWLNLCPNNKISGGKLISSTLMKKRPNTASQAFRNAANAVQRSDNWLGDYYRRMKARGGNKYAMVATANKIATIYYTMVRYKKEFNPLDLKEYQQKYRQAKISYLERKLLDLKKDVA
ncbi:MAG TPA: IS110 family transposase [Puia sp.]|uniref:IS110 family transposase n=1 Tax=Puia sp. TaxID=2045100 RepID=UPI002CF7268C|nr:IS110 family transposase [Puia sp.]HVU98502.1 IS110 family transposase [Puia sp.]